jgi:hypothetical protein
MMALNSVADFGCSVWLNCSHVKQLDAQLNEALRTVTGCVRDTPTEWLPVLSNIVPHHIRRKKALSKLLDNCDFYENFLLFDIKMEPIQQRLRSRKILCEIFNEVKYIHVEQKWNEIWEEASLFGNEMLINAVKFI